jgi:hypothetical protein
MSLILHLGVDDIPYVEAPSGPRRMAKSRPGKQKKRPSRSVARGSEQTTGEVASILEAKYNLMRTFFETQEEAIAEVFAQSMANSLDQLLASPGAIAVDPFGSAMSKVEAMFKHWLSSGEAERVGIPGTPTKAALKRRSLRFKSKKADGPRPSFIDTALFEGSFRSWVEQRSG